MIQASENFVRSSCWTSDTSGSGNRETGCFCICFCCEHLRYKIFKTPNVLWSTFHVFHKRKHLVSLNKTRTSLKCFQKIFKYISITVVSYPLFTPNILEPPHSCQSPYNTYQCLGVCNELKNFTYLFTWILALLLISM